MNEGSDISLAGGNASEACRGLADAIADVAGAMAFTMGEIAEGDAPSWVQDRHDEFVERILPPFAWAEEYFRQLSRDLDTEWETRTGGDC